MIKTKVFSNDLKEVSFQSYINYIIGWLYYSGKWNKLWVLSFLSLNIGQQIIAANKSLESVQSRPVRNGCRENYYEYRPTNTGICKSNMTHYLLTKLTKYVNIIIELITVVTRLVSNIWIKHHKWPRLIKLRVNVFCCGIVGYSILQKLP